MFVKYGNVPEGKLIVLPNSARKKLFSFSDNCKLSDRSIYLARVESRKRQYIFQHYPANIDYAGNYNDYRFNQNHPDYLGEWSRTTLYETLTDYANLVLLSDGEAHPLVVPEALMAGLGLVLSEFATANLDLSKPFIDIIPEKKIRDKEYVCSIIAENRKKSVTMRREIRQYGLDNFDTELIAKQYLEIINSLL